jgi:HK97 family phage major capsid protein
MDILELRKQWTDLLNQMNGLVESAKRDNRLLDEKELTQYDDLKKRQAQIEANIERAEELNQLNAKRSTTVTREPGVVVTRNEGEDANGECKVWRSLGDQLAAVARAGRNPHDVDKKLDESQKIMRAATGLNEAVGADGGFLVQTNFVEGLLRRTYETGILASRVRRASLTGKGNSISLNVVDDNSRVSGSRLGGIQAFWENEGDLYIASKPRFRQMGLVLKKLTGLCYATEELLEDTGMLETIITEGFTEEFGYKIDEAILYGTGAGQPLGIMNSGAVITVPKVTGQAAGTLAYENVLAMRGRLWARSRANSVWLINQDVEGSLATMVFTPAGGSSIPVYMPAGGAAGAQYDTLFNRPILPIEQAKTLGATGDVILADLSQYFLVDKGAMQKATSVHVRFIYDEMTYKFTYRVDGQPIWNAALTPANGTNTVSPFVALATRA